MSRVGGLSIPFIVINRDSVATDLPDYGRFEDNSPTVKEYSTFLTCASDYSKYPSDFGISAERARRLKLQDRKKFRESGGLLPFWIDKESLKKYSVSSYFYFDFLEQGIYSLLITFLICGINDMITILTLRPASLPVGTTTNFVYRLSAFNIGYVHPTLTIKITLTIINIIVIKLYGLFKEKKRIKNYLALNHMSQNYFSVLVQGLPENLDIPAFYDFLAEHLPGKSADKIKQVLILQDNSAKEKLLEYRKKIYVRSLDSESETLKARYIAELEKIDEQIANEDYKLAGNKRFNGSVIVVFEDTYTVVKLLKKWHKINVPRRIASIILKKFGYYFLEQYEFQGKLISIEKLGEPFDVLWQNTGKSNINIFMRGLFTSTILWAAVLAYPLINIIVTTKENKEVVFNHDDLLSNVWTYTPFIFWIVLSILVITLLINFLSIFSGLRRKTDIEKRKITMKVAFSFISYGMLIIAKAFLDSQGDSKNAAQNTKESLINTVFLLMFYLIFLIPIIEIVDVEFIFRYLRKRYVLWRQNFNSLSQAELDSIMADSYFDFSTRVSTVAQIVFLGMVAAPIFPLAPILAMAALYTASVTDRYLILRRHSHWKLLGANLSVSFQKAYNYNMPVQVIGLLLFLTLTLPKSELQDYQYFLIFAVGLGYIYSFVKFLGPMIAKYAFASSKIKNMRYDEEESRFLHMYEVLYQDYLLNGK